MYFYLRRSTSSHSSFNKVVAKNLIERITRQWKNVLSVRKVMNLIRLIDEYLYVKPKHFPPVFRYIQRIVKGHAIFYLVVPTRPTPNFVEEEHANRISTPALIGFLTVLDYSNAGDLKSSTTDLHFLNSGKNCKILIGQIASISYCYYRKDIFICCDSFVWSCVFARNNIV